VLKTEHHAQRVQDIRLAILLQLSVMRLDGQQDGIFKGRHGGRAFFFAARSVRGWRMASQPQYTVPQGRAVGSSEFAAGPACHHAIAREEVSQMTDLAPPAHSARPASDSATDRRSTIPFARRPLDIAFVVFFLVNLCFITYIVDIEQIIIADPFHFAYPLWPPPPLVDMVHWWGRTFDPVLLARPVWWKATIWIDALGFGPFYAVAIYAYSKGKDWIRLPSIIWAAVMLTNVTIIMAEETFGPHATPHLFIVALANLPWLLVPIAVIARMYPREHPFSAQT
jgi:hypothetical protein